MPQHFEAQQTINYCLSDSAFNCLAPFSVQVIRFYPMSFSPHRSHTIPTILMTLLLLLKLLICAFSLLNNDYNLSTLKPMPMLHLLPTNIYRLDVNFNSFAVHVVRMAPLSTFLCYTLLMGCMVEHFHV